jgi:hypothetical protein
MCGSTVGHFYISTLMNLINTCCIEANSLLCSQKRTSFIPFLHSNKHAAYTLSISALQVRSSDREQTDLNSKKDQWKVRGDEAQNQQSKPIFTRESIRMEEYGSSRDSTTVGIGNCAREHGFGSSARRREYTTKSERSWKSTKATGKQRRRKSQS